jgi:ribosomal-protein-serine acetyltransferase
MIEISIEPQLELRLLQTNDALALESLRDGYTSYRNEWLYRGLARNFIEECFQRYRGSSGFCVGIFLKTELAGVVIASIPPGCGSAELDYMLGNTYRGRGLATKAVSALVSFLFRQFKVERVRIRADVNNSKGRAVAERLGFTIQSRVPEAINYGNARGDMVVYEVHQGTWRSA